MDNWRLESNCSKLSPKQFDLVFFPRSGKGLKRAELLCSSCKVKIRCLQEALDTDAYGIWAGTNERQRALMKQPKPRVVPHRKNFKFF